MATRNQGVCGSFNNGIAVVTGIIGGITGFNLNGSQAGAERVFVNRFISIIYNLNGRKVMTWILKDT